MIFDEIIEFKTNFKYFQKEKMGSKPNTVRLIDLEDKRFIRLIQLMYSPELVKGKIGIRITNKDVTNLTFVRRINDISIYENLMIISWEHFNDE